MIESGHLVDDSHTRKKIVVKTAEMAHVAAHTSRQRHVSGNLSMLYSLTSSNLAQSGQVKG